MAPSSVGYHKQIRDSQPLFSQEILFQLGMFLLLFCLKVWCGRIKSEQTSKNSSVFIFGCQCKESTWITSGSKPQHPITRNIGNWNQVSFRSSFFPRNNRETKFVALLGHINSLVRIVSWIFFIPENLSSPIQNLFQNYIICYRGIVAWIVSSWWT